MFIHKYSVGDRTLYLVSDKAARPSKIMNIGPDEWRGMSSGASVANAAKFLGDLSFKKDIPEEEPAPEKEPEKEPAPEKELTEAEKTAATKLDEIANEIQEQDPVVAYLIDCVSDQLEGKKK